MSRIAGCVGHDLSASTPLLERMMDASRAASVVAGSTRTAAVGQAAIGHWGWSQPGLTLTEQLLVAIDGGIHNRIDLGGSDLDDSRLLASLYHQYGFESMLPRLNGEFTIALYDAAINTLWLARDRFGVKPLYYWCGDNRFAFASRPRALLTLPDVPCLARRSFVARFAGLHYRTFDNVPGESPFEAISQVEPGQCVRVRGRDVAVTRWWWPEDLPDHDGSELELAEEYKSLLLDSVAIRYHDARRPAFTLSGGMDSSSVLCCANIVSSRRLTAFSTVYDDATYNESEEIRPMLAHAVDVWHPIRVDSPDLAALVPRMIEANDEPVATATWLSHYALCHAVKSEGFDTMFGGLGGDELNAGEYEYFPFFFADLKAAGSESRLASEIEWWTAYHDHPIFRKTTETARQGIARLTDPVRHGFCKPDLQRLQRYANTVRLDYFSVVGYEPIMDHPFRSCLKNRSFQDLFRETTPCCLRAADRHATAFGLEVSWPFLDHRLVDFMFRIPGTLKIRDGVTKYLLRKAMTGILPDETRLRVKKTGWNAPAHVWFAGQGREFLMDLVASRAFQQRNIYDLDRVYGIISEHQDIVESARHAENHMMFLWQLVNLETWLLWVDRMSHERLK